MLISNAVQIVTACNKRYEVFLNVLEKQSAKLGYDLSLYNLGDLDRGIPAYVKDELFNSSGKYHRMHGDWWTKALHKPKIIEQSLRDRPIAYLDADAFPIRRFDEIWDSDFDIAVTTRTDEENIHIFGPINAGVIFFNPSAKPIVKQWLNLTEKMGNDQLALAEIIKNPEFIVKKIPAMIYNYYKFPARPPHNTAIYHFKDDPHVRSCFNDIVSNL